MKSHKNQEIIFTFAAIKNRLNMLHIVDKDKEFPLLITTVVQAEPWKKGHIARFALHPFNKTPICFK